MQFKEYVQQLPPYKPPALTNAQPAEMVKLSSNENPLGPSPRAVAALHAALPIIHRYPDSTAATLRAALAQRADVTPNMVLCSNGSDELVALLCLAFLREGDDAVMAQGTFVSYAMRTQQMGARPVRVPLQHYTHDLPALAAALTPATRLVFVCNPNNPTGTTVGADEVAALLRQVPDEVLMVLDEAYIEFATRPDFPDLLPELRGGRSNLILLRTFAKLYGLAGLRLGYAYGHPDVIAYLHRVRSVFNVNALAQVAGLAALDDTEHVERSLAYARECNAFFVRELAALGLQPISSEANFIAVDVGDDTAVAAALRERGFAVTPLSGWGVPGSIRISFGTTEQNERFVQSLKDVLAHTATPDVGC